MKTVTTRKQLNIKTAPETKELFDELSQSKNLPKNQLLRILLDRYEEKSTDPSMIHAPEQYSAVKPWSQINLSVQQDLLERFYQLTRREGISRGKLLSRALVLVSEETRASHLLKTK